MINDCFFYTSLVFFVIGFLIKKNSLIFVGVTIAAISRQTSILLIPILILMNVYKHISFKFAVILVLDLIVIYIINKVLTIKFYGPSHSNYILLHAFGLFSWLLENFSLKGPVMTIISSIPNE